MSAAPWLAPLAYAALNIASASGIVFANKMVFSVYNFNFTCTLTLIHTIFTIVGLRLFAAAKLFRLRQPGIPSIRVAPLASAFVAYIVLCNWNLNINTVGFYQISKILVAPVVLVLEACVYGRYPTLPVVLSVTVVCVGIGIATIQDTNMSSNLKGLMVGLGAVMSTAMYQIWAGSKQKELGVGSAQLLYASTPISAMMLVAIVPCTERLGIRDPTPDSILGFHYTLASVAVILLSAVLGLVVSLSTFLVIGATSSLTYNIVGHLKTVIILAGGCLFFGDSMPIQKLAGVMLALGGIVWFSHLQLKGMKLKSESLPVTAPSPQRVGVIATSPRHHRTFVQQVKSRLLW